MIKIKFHKNTFLHALFIFPFLVIFGTLSHELGHIIMAQILGFETILHYGSMDYYINGINGEEIANPSTNFLITIAGVLQTIITGTIGIIILKYTKHLWFGVYLSLFWSREVINLIMSTLNGVLYKKSYFGGDELILSNILNLPEGTFSIILGIIGLFACLYAILKIPLNLRLSFLLGGLISGILSYILWFSTIGLYFLP
ncbi:MAG: hypothetical protein HF967_00160 [Methanosarcinales archaeon]|nr:hypothetical protein [Methanosarcinales archaeon]